MKKHFKSYVTGWASPGGPGRPRDGAKDLRLELMGVTSAKEVEEVVKEYLASVEVDSKKGTC